MTPVTPARTRKPCPGCGTVSRYRPAAEVCGKCKAALEEWNKHVLHMLEKAASKKVVTLVGQSHWWPGFYYGGPSHHLDGFDSTRDGLRDLFDLVGRLVCEQMPVGKYHPSDQERKSIQNLYHREVVDDPREKKKGQHWCPRLNYPTSDRDPSSGNYALIDPPLAEALQRLWDHVARFAHMSYLGGVMDGRNLLLQLNSGGLSSQDLAEQDVRIAKCVQTEGLLAKALSGGKRK